MKVLSFYYKKYVWDTLYAKDSNQAGEVDYEIRGIIKKLGIRPTGSHPALLAGRFVLF
ncbi:MAG: hypothetical protein HFE84_00375 [Lachnospiraceae bacterium]|nr:hypothetical protein [Lachnospiraceae bacterium]